MTRLDTFKALTREIGGIRKPLLVLALFKLWNLVCGLIPLFLYSLLVKQVLVDKHLNELWPVLAGYLAVFLLTTIGIAVSQRFSNQLILKYDLRLKHKLLNKLLRLDHEVYSTYSMGDVKSRIEQDAAVAGKFFMTHILDYSYAVVYAGALAIILLCYDWKIALLSFVFVPVSLYTVNFLGERTRKAGEELWKLQNQYESFLHSNLQNWKDIKTNNLEEAQLAELNGHYKKIRPVWFRNQLYLHLGISYSFFTKNFITQLFIYFIGGIFVIQGYSQVGVLLVFISFYGQFFGFIERISNSLMNYKNDSVNISKVIGLLHAEADKRPYKRISGMDIDVQNLQFRYEGNDSFALEGISFSVSRGEHLAITGQSGSGKSTLAKLLTGQRKPQGGKVSIGGIDLAEVNGESVSGKVSIVVQEPVLFNMTIRENLLLAKAGATEAELIACCRRASIYEWIESLEHQLDTRIGEKGVKLSGGQKQRLSIARVLLQDRDIIIFDESTSALDHGNESDIITELQSLSSGKTMISIAHRLSTIQGCDKVMVLQAGRVVAYDTHTNLFTRNEAYDMLFQSQYVYMNQAN
ncbi:ABC transporter ATP-binding protein [Paenibacillus tritici]|uniref:ABC transporter ATP-binding protein n=1 Tax=Paenibacillus tritici TaxID=1873425 RepID=A0ABX2DUI0_9BACL|nr:ABC transporter ATP-binding protein [Paenibacillus tritici]NQX48354.1 ABC transporter ATP-binding protein [Paenibacillus tritici]